MTTTQMQGIDVSTWQGAINWAVTAPAIDFAMVKATDGITEVDNQHAANVAGLRAHGKPLGHYHYPEGGDAAAEARWFVQHAGRLPGELQELDFEGEILTIADPVGWATVWMQNVIGETGNRPLIYMSASTVTRFDFARLVALDIGLHVADWNADTPRPGEWPFIIERQTSDHGSVPGIASAVDKDVFYGDAATWAAYGANTQPAPPPSPAPAPAPTPAPAPGGVYSVVQGDNLTIIANHFHVSVADLVEWNVGVYPTLRTNDNLIQVGWVLHVTGAGPTPFPIAGEVWYTVVHGDNLTTIAEHHGTTWQQLVTWNEGHYPSLAGNPNLIGVGWVLRVG